MQVAGTLSCNVRVKYVATCVVKHPMSMSDLSAVRFHSANKGTFTPAESPAGKACGNGEVWVDL